MPASSPEVSNNDPTMESGSDDDTTPEPALMRGSFTMEQVQAHYDTAMADEEQPAPAPMSAFQQAQEERRCNKFLLVQH